MNPMRLTDCYHYDSNGRMGQALIRKLPDETIEEYREAARAKGRSLEAELRSLIEEHRPARRKDPQKLRKLAEYHQSMTPSGERLTDSTDFIRWDRDTNHGDWIDDGWSDDDVRD